jgi:CheY-like chemotaxis protein
LTRARIGDDLSALKDHKSILVVEDNADVRGALAALLEGEGYSVVEAEHGLAALKQLRGSAAFCLILLDLFMPTMNGWEFRAEQMRDPGLAGIPVIVITADAAARRNAEALGVAECMTKPVDFERLLALVAEHC